MSVREGLSDLVNGAAMLSGAACVLLGAASLLRNRRAVRLRLTAPVTLATVVLLAGAGAISIALLDRSAGAFGSEPALRVGAVAILLACAGTAWTLARLAPPGPRRGRWAAMSWASFALGAVAPFVPGFMAEATDTAWRGYLVATLLVIVGCFVGGAVDLFVGAPQARGLARDHTRLLAAGLLLYGIATPFGAWAYALAPDGSGWAALVFWVLLAPASTAIAPPAPVRVALRRRATTRRQARQARLFEATSQAEALDILLPTLAQSLGTRALALLDADGSLEWASGLTDRELAGLVSGLPPRKVFADSDEAPTVLPLREGTLVAVPHPLTPHAGLLERDHLELVAQELDLALLAAQRLTALASERRRRQQLQNEHYQLDANNAALRAYSRAIAHDIKTPLTVIRGAAETIGKLEDLSPAARDLLDRVIEHSDRVSGMIDDQLHAATDVTEVAAVSLHDVCRWLHDTLGDELAEQQSTLEWSDDLPTVEANRGLVQRVLLNLVRNALQHATGAGPVTVWIHPGRELTILVTDDGTGMRPDDAARIFEPGVRLDRAGAGGLGLADSRAALRRLGGDLEVLDTAPGAGTTMALLLPGPRPPGGPEQAANGGARAHSAETSA